MKIKKIICGAVFITGLMHSLSAVSQINYSEDFEGTINWSNPDGIFYQGLPAVGCSQYTYATNIYSDYATLDVSSVSPTIGFSNGGVVTLSYGYKITKFFMTGVGLENTPDWGEIVLAYSTTDVGPWITVDAINPQNHTVSAECATRTIQFTPPADTNIYLKLTVLVNGQEPGIDGELHFDNLVIAQSEPCATLPPAELPSGQTVCSNTNIGDLNIGNYDTIIWYSAATGGTPLASGVIVTNGATYYAANFEECESIERTAVTVSINTVQQPEVLEEQVFCAGATVDDLQVIDENATVQWYDTLNSETPLAGAVSLSNETYFVSQLIDGCESGRTPVNVTVITVPVPIIESPQVFEDNQPFTVLLYDIEVDAEGEIRWYATLDNALSGNNVLPETTMITESGTYYVTQLLSGCESAPVEVVIDITLGTVDFSGLNFSVYPNPVNDTLNITAEEIDCVKVYNSLGQQVIYINALHENQAVNMEQLLPGIYIVNVESGAILKTFKVVKQ